MLRWGRKRVAEQAAEPRDASFTFFTVSQAQRFRALAQRTFAEAGAEVVLDGDDLVASDGRRFGLWNLAALCNGAAKGERGWAGLVQQHADTVLRATGMTTPAELSDDEVLARTYLRLMSTSNFTDEQRAGFTYARDLAGDLIEVLALDSPETVTMLRDEDVERVGAEALHAAGLERLVREPYDSYELARGDGGERLHVVTGESVYVASKLLVLPDLLRRTTGDGEPPHGVLVAVPSRHQLAFHPVEDLAVVPSLQALVLGAAQGYAEDVGALSPYVFWWRGGTLTQLSYLEEDGTWGVDATGDFGDVLRELGAADEE